MPDRSDVNADCRHWRSPSCDGEPCRMCEAQASHKVGEEFLDDPDRPTSIGERGNGFAAQMMYDQAQRDPYRKRARHNLTQYLCCGCFVKVMGAQAGWWCFGE